MPGPSAAAQSKAGQASGGGAVPSAGAGGGSTAGVVGGGGGTGAALNATRREGDGDDVVYLRTEDDLCLAVAMHGDLSPELYRRRDYLGARVFGSQFCELFSSSDKESPADLWSCTFRLEQAVSVRALQELIMTQDLNAGTARRVLLYGHAIRLRHLPSQKFLGCLDTSSSGDKLAFDVGLAAPNAGESTWWRIHPASKQRSEGEKVRAGDDIILVSISTERYLNTEGVELIQASFQQTFWRIIPVCVGTARAAAVGHVNGCDVIRLFHRHVSQCLVARKDADVQNRHPMYEVGVVAQQARSLWRVELLRMRFGHAFLGWGFPFRLRHMISGKYLCVVDSDTSIAEMRAQPTLEQSVFCMLSSPDSEMVFEEKEVTMGKPQIKFGDHVVYIRHMHTGLWIGHQSTKNRKRIQRHVVKSFQPVVMATEHHVDLGFTLTRAGAAELYAGDVMHIALKEMRHFRVTIQNQEVMLSSAKQSFTGASSSTRSSGGPPPDLNRSASTTSNLSSSASSSGLGSSLNSSRDSPARRPSPTRLQSVPEFKRGRSSSPADDGQTSPGENTAGILSAMEENGSDAGRYLRRRSASRKRMFQFRQQSSFSIASSSVTSEGEGLKRKSGVPQLSPELEQIMDATIGTCEHLKEIIDDLMDYFHWPVEKGESGGDSYDSHQQQLRLLQHRQDLFQQQGLADLIIDTIELVGRHLNNMCTKSLQGRKTGFSLVMVNRAFLTLLGTVVRGNARTCTTFAREKHQCLDWLAERLRDFYADGVLQVLHYLLQESTDALNMVKEKHIQALIKLLDTKGRDPKVLEVLASLCSCAGNVAVRRNQNTIANMLLPLRGLLLQTNHYQHIECVRPLVFVRSSREDSAYHCWYCEVHVISFNGDIETNYHSYPLHLRVGWATSDGVQCWPGHASSSGLEAVGGTLSSVGYDGRSIWCGGQECRVPTVAGRRVRGRSGSLHSAHTHFKTIDDTLKEKETPEKIRCRELHTTYFRPGDKIGLCIDLHRGTVTFTLNNQLLDCHVAGFNPQFSAVFPVVSMDAGVRCAFHFGGKSGPLAYQPPPGYACLEEAIIEGRDLNVQRCVETGDLKHLDLVGPPCLADHGAFIPNPVDTKNVVLPSDLMDCADMVARNVHENWALTKITNGWTFGERDNDAKTNPCICPYAELTPVDKDYDSRMVLQMMRTLIVLGYSVGIDSTRHEFDMRYVNLNKKLHRQSNGYIPQPLDLEDIDIPEELGELVEALAEDAHNVWAAQRISEGWSYGHGKCNETKRTPYLLSFPRLSEEQKNDNRKTVRQTLKTILACGYTLKEPTRKEEALRREASEATWKECRTFRGQHDQAIGKGKWYYEVELQTHGFMRVGWCTVDLSVTSMPGSDQNAFVFDGFLARKWNNGSETFGRTWQEHDVIGCLLDLEQRTISFTLNGALLVDAVGQDVAFDNLPEGQRFLPVICLGPAQRVTCLLGRDLGQLKMFNQHGLQQGYEPLCSMFNHFMPMWASCNMPVYVDIGTSHPRLLSINQPPLPNRPPCLRVSSKTVRGTDTPRMECIRLNLGIPLDGSVEMGKYCYDVILAPGQCRMKMFIGWLSSEFRPEPGILERLDTRKVTVCLGSWKKEETEGTESNEEGSSEDEDCCGSEIMECQSMHVARVKTLLSNIDVDNSQPLQLTCVVDTEEGVITFRHQGEELINHELHIPSEPRLLYPVMLFVPTGEDILDFEFSSQEDCMNLFDAVLSTKKKHYVVPPRLRLEIMEDAEWRMLPVNLPPIKSRSSKSGEVQVNVDKPRMSVMVEISRELHSWSLPELVEMPQLMSFHTKTLDLYSGLCMQGNELITNRITCDHVTKQQLMECAKMDDLPGPLNRSFFRLLSTLHLEKHVNARLLTRSEFVIPLELVKKASKLYTASDSKSKFSVARSSLMGRVLPGMGMARRPDEGLSTKGKQSLCSSLTRASNQSCSIRHCLQNRQMDFDLPQLKTHVLATLKQALAQHSYDNFRLTEQRQIDILVPLLSCCDELLVMGLFDDNNIQQLLVLLDPSSFADEETGDGTDGLVCLPLHEDVKLQVCRLLQHLCDLQLRHRVEGIVSFADTFVSGMQLDQGLRLDGIKNAPSFSAAITAKMTKEFRMSPKEQMRVLLAFRDCMDTSDSALKEPLKIEMMEFHERLLQACSPERCYIPEQGKHVESSPSLSTCSSSDGESESYRTMLRNLVGVVRRRASSISEVPEPQSIQQADSLQRLICTTMLSWAQQSILSPVLVREVFDLLYRQYNSYKEVMAALAKAYVVEGNGLGRIQNLLEALGNVRSLLRVKMDTQEESLLCDALSKLRNNTMIYQHPDLMRLLGVHETVLAVMRNVLGEVDTTMFSTTTNMSSGGPSAQNTQSTAASMGSGPSIGNPSDSLQPPSNRQHHRLSGAEAIGMDHNEVVQEPLDEKAACQSPATVAACCRFLTYFCRTSHNNQRAMFDHLGYLLNHSGTGIVSSTAHTINGGTPLDVAAATIRGHHELSLALKDWQLDHVVLLLASSVTGLTTQELLGQKNDNLGSMVNSAELFASSDSFSMDEWKPNDGERYLNFLRQAVSVNGQTIEENASVVVRLLIRRPECLGPGLDGEGQGLLAFIREYLYYIDISLIGCKHACERDDASKPAELTKSSTGERPLLPSRTSVMLSRRLTDVAVSTPLEYSAWRESTSGGAGGGGSGGEPPRVEMTNAQLASEVLAYYANLLDLLARCTNDLDDDGEQGDGNGKLDAKDMDESESLDLSSMEIGIVQNIFYNPSGFQGKSPLDGGSSSAPTVHRTPSQRRRAILQSLISLPDMLGLLEIPFVVIESEEVEIVRRDDGTTCEKVHKAPVIKGVQPQHKAAFMLFLQRVYGVPDQKTLFAIVEKSILTDLRVAATVGNAQWYGGTSVLELNRYICSSVMPFLVRYVRLFRDSEHNDVTLDTMLHTLYALSKSCKLSLVQRDSISDFLCKLIKQLRPSILQRLLRKLVQDIPKLTKTTDVALTVLHCHYDHCARYYGLASGWGAFGAASNEEKDLTMQLFMTLLNKLSSKSISDGGLYCKALECLCAICSAMAPDYLQPKHLMPSEASTEPGMPTYAGFVPPPASSGSADNTEPVFRSRPTISVFESMEAQSVDDSNETFMPQPTDTSNVELTDDLEECVEVFSAHCHDTWAMRKFAHGYHYGPERDVEKRLHPLLRPYKDLSENDKELSRNPCKTEIQAMIAWGWSLRRHDNVNIHLIPSRVRAMPRGHNRHTDYTPQPFDLSNIPLSKAMMSMAERLAENRYDAWALAKITAARRTGGQPLRHQLLEFDMLPSKEKEEFRILARETLKFLLLCGYRVDRSATPRLDNMARQCSATSMVERRYSYVLFNKIIRRQEHILAMLVDAGRLKLMEFPATRSTCYVPTAPECRSTNAFSKSLEARLRSLAILYMPLATHYFKCHHQYFMPLGTDRKRYGMCSRGEKAQVGDFFFNLVLILQAQDSVFGQNTVDIVAAAETVVKAFDMSLLSVDEFPMLCQQMSNFFAQACDDLASCIMSRCSGNRDGYVFTVLVPLLTFVFTHIREHSFGPKLIKGDLLFETEKIISRLYYIGTELNDLDHSLQPVIGECLAAISSAMPMAFLEKSTEQVDSSKTTSTMNQSDGEMPVLSNLLVEVEDALAVSREERGFATDNVDEQDSTDGDDDVNNQILSDSNQEVPHAITVVVPMLSSYMDRWWDKGADGMCVFGKRVYPTVINTKMVDTVLTQAMEIISNQFGQPRMDWICQAACDLAPIMRTCSVELLKTMFLPISKKLSQRVQALFSRDQHYQRTRCGPKEEAEISQEYNILARDTFAFFTLCTAFVTAHREKWSKPPLPKELVHFFLYLADVLHCWHFSLNFRREFQVCTAAIAQRFKGQRRYTLSAPTPTPESGHKAGKIFKRSSLFTISSSLADNPVAQNNSQRRSLFPAHSSQADNPVAQRTSERRSLFSTRDNLDHNPAAQTSSRQSSLFSVHSSLAGKSSEKKVSGATPFVPKSTQTSGKATAASSRSHGNVIVQCLNKLHTIIIQDLTSLDSSLVQKGLSLMLRGAKEHEVADHVINVLQHQKKNKMSSPKLRKRLSLGQKAQSIVSMLPVFKPRSEPDLDLRLQRIMNLIRVIYRLHNVDNPSPTAKHVKRWRKLITRERKRTIINCFLMVPLHKLPRDRAINHFLDIYRSEWLVPSEPKAFCLIEDIKTASSMQARKKSSSHTKRDVSSSEMSLLALEGAMDPKYPVTSAGSAVAMPTIPKRTEVDPLCQIIQLFSRSAKCNKQIFFTMQDPLFIAYANILSSSCSMLCVGNQTLREMVRDMSNHRLLKQQDYLSTSGAAQMVVLVLMGCRGVPSPLVYQTLNLGIAMLTGGNLTVQKTMLEFLKDSTDSEFFASIAGLIESCSVLDMDTYERHNKAETLGVGRTAGDRALHDASMTLALFRFLQLLCEGHNLGFQNYLRTQPGNTSTINIVFHTVDYLHRLQESVSDFFWHYVGRQTIDGPGRDNLSRAMSIAKQVFCTLTEYIQGPCVHNQLSLAKSRLWDAVGGFLHVFAKLQIKLSQDPSQLELLRELLELEKEMSVTLLAMLEETNVTIADKMVETLMESVEHVEEIFKFFGMFLKLNDLATSQAFKDYDTNRDGWISNKEFEKAMDAQKMYNREEIAYLMKCADTNNDGRLDYMEFIERFHTHSSDIGFSFAVLLTNLSDHLPNDPRLAHFLNKGASFLSHFEPYLGCVEIIGRNRKVERIYFHIKKSTKTEWERPTIRDSTREFFHTVERGNQREKLLSFLDFCEDTIFEMQHGCRLSNTEHTQRVQRAEMHMRNAHLLVNMPLSWTYYTIKAPLSAVACRCCDLLQSVRNTPFYVKKWLGVKSSVKKPEPPPQRPRSENAISKLITGAIKPDQAPSNLASSVASTPETPQSSSNAGHPLTPRPFAEQDRMKLKRLPSVQEQPSQDETDGADGSPSKTPSPAKKPILERHDGNVFHRYRRRSQSRADAQQEQQQQQPSSPSKRSSLPRGVAVDKGSMDVVDGPAVAGGDAGASAGAGVRQRRITRATLSPLPRHPSQDGGLTPVNATSDLSPVRRLSQRLSGTLSSMADSLRRSFGSSCAPDDGNAMPATAFSYIGTCHSTSSDIAQCQAATAAAAADSGESALNLPLSTAASRNVSRNSSLASSVAATSGGDAGATPPVGASSAGTGDAAAPKRGDSDSVAPASKQRSMTAARSVNELYKPQIALIQGSLLSLFGRCFTGTKMTALVLAFFINFLLLFFRVVHTKSFTTLGNDSESHTTASQEEVGVEEHYQHVLGPLMFCLGIVHFLVSCSALLGYGMLKIPLALFKREKRIIKELQFNGKWILDSSTSSSMDRWDTIVLQSKSFPRHYWDGYVKRSIRNKYAPQVGMERVCDILNVPSDDTCGKIRDDSKVDYRYLLWAAGVLAMDKMFLYNLLWVVFSFLGNCNSYFFFSLHLLDVVGSISTLRTVLKSVTHNGRQLMMTFLMTCVVVYIYTVLAFNFFRKFYEKEVDGGHDPKCNNMLTCFAFHMYAGLRSGGGIGDSIKDPDGDEYELPRMVFDITFFFFVIIILLAIIQGLIIDSFGELRDREEEVKSDDETKCFVCGIGKERFDVTPHGFQLHVEKEHNISNYLFLFMYLFTKDTTEHTGQESYILENVKVGKLDFFPVGAAFRLSAEEHAHAASANSNHSHQQTAAALTSARVTGT
ncbi:ryanodine receptor 3-like isoform X2 [Sycon ciliatum]|uniref:ryanodine receptor 3-like isoform X2 n=1 Tax=Sycon ciliatum TaxID=27933 RepID=UPI0031F653A3